MRPLIFFLLSLILYSFFFFFFSISPLSVEVDKCNVMQLVFMHVRRSLDVTLYFIIVQLIFPDPLGSTSSF